MKIVCMEYELLYLKPVKPNHRIVRDKAEDFSIKLSGEQVHAFAELDNMFDLRMVFREIERTS